MMQGNINLASLLFKILFMNKIIGFILSFLGLVVIILGIFIIKKPPFILGGCIIIAIAMGNLFYRRSA